MDQRQSGGNTPTHYKKTWLIVLECHHELHFNVAPPVEGDILYCRRCTKYLTVIIAPPEYRIRCQSCRYSRGYGAARVDALNHADEHVNRHPTHTAITYNGHNIVSEHSVQQATIGGF